MSEDSRKYVEDPTHYVATCKGEGCIPPQEYSYDLDGWNQLMDDTIKHMDSTGHEVHLSTKKETENE